MATSLPWSVKGVDPRTRDAAKAAARRAGMTLGEWLDHKIRDEAEAEPGEPQAEPEAPEQLDIAALSERLAKLSQGQMQTSSQPAASGAQRPGAAPLTRNDIEAIVNQAAAAERLTRESSAKTAGALDSITRWIEKTESRISTGERAAAERQERATSVIADAIKTMGERLVEIERKAHAAPAPQPQPAPARSPQLVFNRDSLAHAVSDIRSRQRMLDHDEQPEVAAAAFQPASETRIAALRKDLRDLSARIAPAPLARPAAHEAEAVGGTIEAALAALAARLDKLDRNDRFDAVVKPLARLESDMSRLTNERPHENYQRIEREIGHLAAKLDRSDRLDAVVKPLARIESDMSRLAQERSQESYQRIEREISHLAAKVDALAERGMDRSVLAPVLRDIAELREMIAAPAADPRLDDLSRQIATLSSELARSRESQVDSRDMHSLALAIEEVRDAIHSDHARGRDSDTASLMSLSRQVETLASKFDALPAMRPDLINAQAEQLATRLREMDATGRGPSHDLSDRIEALVIRLEDMAGREPTNQIETRLDTLQERLETLSEQGPTGVMRQIEALSGRIESLAASTNLTQIINDGKAGKVARIDLRPVEDMLRSLAEKIDDAGRPGAGAGAFDALEQQIAGLAQRLDAAAATRSAETGIERTLQDLVAHLQTMRQDTAEAAERAARAAMADMADKSAPPIGLAELNSLVSGLHETNTASGRETQDAIGAMHQALETVISRLANIETELSSGREAARPVLPPRAAESVRPTIKAAPLRQTETGASLSAAPEDRIGTERVQSHPLETAPAVLSAELPLDLPLEPGSGRPRREAASPQGAQDPQSIRQSLIAAARRSAKAATEAAATAPNAAPEPAKSGGRLKDIMEKRRKPLLLGLAALILALGTAHVVTGALRGGAVKQAGAEAVESPVVAPAAPAASEPAKDQSSALSPIGAAPAPVAAPAAASMTQAPGALAENTASMTLPPAAATPGPAQTESQPALAAVTGVDDLPATLGTAGLRKAAQGGDARAVYELASRAVDGPGPARDPKLALRLFERAAVAGLVPAQFRLGNMFEKGVGAPRDATLARTWYTRAAEHGNAKAMHNLAVLYAEGASGKPDYASAVEWFQRAADVGVRDSQYNLAILLGRGLGASTDLGQSYVWFAVAAGQGDEDAAKKRDEVALRMTPADLAAAKAKAADWKPKALDPAANEVAPPAKGWDEVPSAAAKKPAKPARG